MKSAEQSVFSVQGMSCQGCVNSIQNVLEAIDGVRSVSVDLAHGTVRVSHETEVVSASRLVQAIEGAGYEVQESAE